MQQKEVSNANTPQISQLSKPFPFSLEPAFLQALQVQRAYGIASASPKPGTVEPQAPQPHRGAAAPTSLLESISRNRLGALEKKTAD